MHLCVKPGWALPESAATPESIYLNRRSLIKGAAAGTVLAALPSQMAQAEIEAEDYDPTADLYPAESNPRYTVERDVTDMDISSRYNNFYEFGSHKKISVAAQALYRRPWTLEIDGMVETAMTIGIDDLIRRMPIEERICRHRCVEAWSMVIPWSGFPLRKLVEYARPTTSAKYLRMETFHDPEIASGQRQFWYPWPYVEGLTMAEATNELTFLVTGAYGKPMAKQYGSPLRLAVPWKYGFKHIKSIVKFTFTDERPISFWERLAPSEYGFWANVNPDVPHPRWSQATERDIGTDRRIPTRLFNGYGEYVSDMYVGLEGERLYM